MTLTFLAVLVFLPLVITVVGFGGPDADTMLAPYDALRSQ